MEDLEASHASADFLCLETEDTQRVQNAINETGSNACGIMGIDLWILNEKDGKLHHFGEGLNWVNPIYQKQLMDGRSDNTEKLNTLKRLVDSSLPDHYHPIAQPCGVDLAGNFWQQYGSKAASASDCEETLCWREIKAFTSDPDQIPSERMFAIAKVFGKCVGIPFNIFGEVKGCVILFARATAEERIINVPSNIMFLRVASLNIATTLAMSLTRVGRTKARKEIVSRLYSKIRISIETVNIFKSLRSGSNGNQIVVGRDSPSDEPSIWEMNRPFIQNGRRMVKRLAVKSKAKIGSLKNKTLHPPGLTPPPPATLFVSTWSFVCCFIILSMMFGLKDFLSSISGGELNLTLPPFGALMTLQFALTAAPASQPRNNLFGFALSISIVILNKILLFHLAGLPQWFHASLGTSISLFAMQKCGIIHPPAGAAALIFALSKEDIVSDLLNIAVFLAADIIAICSAIFLNNLSETRQYPMYWGLNPFQQRKNL